MLGEEREQMRDEAEYLAVFLQEILLSHYDKMSDHVHLSVVPYEKL